MRILLSVPQDFLDVLSAVGGVFYGKINHAIINAICTDSRECVIGDAFFAIKGTRYDGNDYINDATSRGAIPIGEGVNIFGIKVVSGKKALLDFAKFYKSRLPVLAHTVGITGSVGKTTTKEFLRILLSERYKIHANRGNFNNEIGVPLTVLSAPRDTEILICELGMNHLDEIRELSYAVEPDIAVITKIGTAHIGNLGSIKKIASAKLEIVTGLTGTLLVPREQEAILSGYANTKTFSAYSSISDFTVSKNRFGLLEIYKSHELITIIDINFPGYHLYECLSAAVSVALELSIPMKHIVTGVRKINDSTYRHRIKSTPYGFDILDDAYNASAESVIASMNYLHDLNGYSGKSILLGDMLELGNKSKEIHTKIGIEIADYGFDNLFLIGSYANDIRISAISAGFPAKRIFTNENLSLPEITAAHILKAMQPRELLLAKASRKVNLDRIINMLINKR